MESAASAHVNKHLLGVILFVLEVININRSV